MPEPTSAQPSQPAAPTPPAATSPSLQDQYELGDTTQPVIDEPAAAPASAPTQAAPAAAAPARDEAGRFLPRATEPAAAPVAHPHHLVRMATDFGIPKAEIDAMTADQLFGEVYTRQREQRALLGQHVAQDVRFAGDTRTPAERQAGRPLTPEQGGQPAADELDLGLSPDAYSPEFIADLNRIIKPLHDQVRALQAKVGAFEQLEGRRQAETYTQQCDRFFAQHADVYGQGTAGEIDPNGVDANRRLATEAAARRLKTGTFAERMARAHAMFYGATPPPPTGGAPNAAANPAADAWRNGGLAVPTHRTPPADPPSDSKAEATVRRILKQNGVLDESTSIDSFPG